jgi:hypothetical protein
MMELEYGVYTMICHEIVLQTTHTLFFRYEKD